MLLFNMIAFFWHVPCVNIHTLIQSVQREERQIKCTVCIKKSFSVHKPIELISCCWFSSAVQKWSRNVIQIPFIESVFWVRWVRSCRRRPYSHWCLSHFLHSGFAQFLPCDSAKRDTLSERTREASVWSRIPGNLDGGLTLNYISAPLLHSWRESTTWY